MKFNLEKAIHAWRLEISQHPGLEPGYIEELESNLRDRIDDFLIQGISESEAFEQAKAKSLLNAESLADEFYKIRRRSSRKAPWKRRVDFLYLFPNYLKVAFRALGRHKGYALTNLLVLGLGLFCSAIIGQYIQYENSYDAFHEHADRLYRLGRHFRSQDYSVLSFPDYYDTDRQAQLASIRSYEEMPEIEEASQFFIFEEPRFVVSQDKKIEIGKMLSTNTPASFFSMFSFPFLKGNAEACAQNPGKMVLTRSSAEKFYGSNWANKPDLLGQSFQIEGESYSLVGVIEDIPLNAHFRFNVLLHQEKIDYWGSRRYLKLKPQVEVKALEEGLKHIVPNFNPGLAKNELFGGDFLQPIRSIHLHSDLLYEMRPGGDLNYLYVFGIMAIIILVITVSNYTNLATAMTLKRGREIALRKVLGAGPNGIIQQFLIESLLLSLFSLPLVILLLHYLLPYFNQFMGVDLKNQFLYQPPYFLALLAGAVLLGFIASLYPAFYLSRQKIHKLFYVKGLNIKTRGFGIRKALITFQFALLIGLGSLTFIINQQIVYVDQKDLGFRNESLIYVNINPEKFPLFREKLKKNPAIKAVGTGSALGIQTFNQLTYKLDQTEEVFDDANQLYLDFEAVKAYDLQTSVDSYFKNPASAPDRLFLMNETAANKLAKIHQMDIQDLIGRKIVMEPEDRQEDGTQGYPHRIDGFFKDIHLFSLKEKMSSYFIEVTKELSWTSQAVIHFQSEDLSKIIAQTQNSYEELQENRPFQYRFQTDNLAELYAQERRLASLTICLSLIAFMLSILGLIALSVFLSILRKKEMGIRKVLGASVGSLIQQFNQEYLALIGIALLLASPLAYYGGQAWLDNFAYRVSIHPLIFILMAVLTLGVTCIAVSLATYRVAQVNPAQVLRDEQ